MQIRWTSDSEDVLWVWAPCRLEGLGARAQGRLYTVNDGYCLLLFDQFFLVFHQLIKFRFRRGCEVLLCLGDR